MSHRVYSIFGVYTLQVSNRLRGGTKKSVLKWCLYPVFKDAYLNWNIPVAHDNM